MDAAAAEGTAKRRPGEGLIFAPRERRLNRFYGLFVALMKVVLPAVAIVLVVLVAAWPQLDQQSKRFRIGPAQIDRDAARNLNMVNARYTGVDESRRPYAITAEAANQLEANSPVIGLVSPKADIVMEDGSWIALTAEDGTYNREQKLLILEGDVNLFHDKGYEFNTASATIDMEMGDAHGNRPVSGQGPFGHLESEGFFIQNRGDRIEFTGRATLTIFPDRVDGDMRPGLANGG